MARSTNTDTFGLSRTTELENRLGELLDYYNQCYLITNPDNTGQENTEIEELIDRTEALLYLESDDDNIEF